MTKVQNFIGGELVDSVSGATMPLVDPSTGQEYATAPISNEQDIDNAYARRVQSLRRLEAHDTVCPAEGDAGFRQRRREERPGTCRG